MADDSIDDAKGKIQEYNGQGSNEMKEAKDEKPGFKAGGRRHRRGGGHASGQMGEARLDRRPRRAQGGSAGHNPYSSASSMSEPENEVAGKGYEGKLKKMSGGLG